MNKKRYSFTILNVLWKTLADLFYTEKSIMINSVHNMDVAYATWTREKFYDGSLHYIILDNSVQDDDIRFYDKLLTKLCSLLDTTCEFNMNHYDLSRSSSVTSSSLSYS